MKRQTGYTDTEMRRNERYGANRLRHCLPKRKPSTVSPEMSSDRRGRRNFPVPLPRLPPCLGLAQPHLQTAPGASCQRRLNGDVPGFFSVPTGFLINLLILSPLWRAAVPPLYLGACLGTHLSPSRSVFVHDLNVGTKDHSGMKVASRRISRPHILLSPSRPQGLQIRS